MKTRAQESKESKKQGSEGPPGCAKRLNVKYNNIFDIIRDNIVIKHLAAPRASPL